MPSVVGAIGDDAHDKLIRDLDELRDHYLKQWSPRFKIMVSDQKLYLGHREDRRKSHEKWRSWSWLGDPARLTDTEVQSWHEILGSLDPPIQVEGVGTEDEWKARGLERYADYFLRGNKWIQTQEMILRDLSVFGYKLIKVGWKEKSYSPMRRPSLEERVAWDERVNEIMKSGRVTDMPDPESEEFPDWLEQVQTVDPNFPEPPGPVQSEVVEYRGPWLFRPSPFEVYGDPFVEDWSEQEVIFQRIVKPRKWGEDMVRKGIFDGEQFERAARSNAEDNRLTKFDQEIASEIGLVHDPQDPIYRNSDEYHEIWRVGDTTAPWLVMLNRKAFVNVKGEHPHWHRQNVFHCIKNTPQERRAFGLGSYHQLRKTFDDRLLFRDILLDGLLLSVMPVFLKSRNLGLPDLHRFMSPGAILEVNDPNGLKRGWESMAGFAELMKVGELLLNDENTQLATWENVQGQASTVGRVSATEAQGRLQQALVRHKKKAERIEEEESTIWPQVFYNAYQRYPQTDPQLAQLRQQIVGEDMQDPLGSEEFTPDTFAEDLAKNVRFRGATTKLNKELQAQQLKDFLATLSQIASATPIPVPILSPQELRTLGKRIYEVLSDKGSPDVFTEEGDAAVAAAAEAHVLQAQTTPLLAQVGAAQARMQLEAILNPQPQIDPNTGQPLPPQGGNGEAPPEAPPEEGPIVQ